MLYANPIEGGERQRPNRSGQRGTCPACAQPVLGKCGPIICWHWAHEVFSDCDPWAEPETPWHLDWKQVFPTECQEIVVGSHRADVITAMKWILEFQHSSISVADIAERENFYGRKLIWIVDAMDCVNNFYFRRTIKHGPTLPNRVPVTFRWKWPRKIWGRAHRAVFLDLGDDVLLRLRWMAAETPCGGWGVLTSAEAFVEWAQIGRHPFYSYCEREGENESVEAIFERQRERDESDYCRYEYFEG